MNEVIRPPMFVATSFNKSVARRFAKNAKYLVRVDVPADCHNACCIEEHSEFQSEKEVLIQPYSPFRVASVDHSAKVVRLTLLDGMNHEATEKASGVHALAKPV